MSTVTHGRRGPGPRRDDRESWKWKWHRTVVVRKESESVNEDSNGCDRKATEEDPDEELEKRMEEHESDWEKKATESEEEK